MWGNLCGPTMKLTLTRFSLSQTARMFNIQTDDKLYLLLWALGSRVFILFALIRFLIVNGLTVLEWVRPHMCVCVRARA